MKKILLTLTLCGLTFIAKSQNASVEKSMYGIQTGFLGIWVHNESKLSNQFVLRSEIGLDTGIYGSDVNGIDGFLLTPTITLEPRWYYNLNKREGKSRRIDGNSGNFISIVPTWGIRRNIGNHFTYETGIGIGYLHYFKKDNVILISEPDVAVNLHLRIGYQF